jgi:hypothetical protein
LYKGILPKSNEDPAVFKTAGSENASFLLRGYSFGFKALLKLLDFTGCCNTAFN